jgi:hypothetical protein
MIAVANAQQQDLAVMFGKIKQMMIAKGRS